MADYKSLVQNNDFKEYRKQQLRVIVEFTQALLKDTAHTETTAHRLRGALEMSNKLIRLPLELVNDNEMTDILNRQITEDIVGVSANLVREYLSEE